MNSSVVTSSLTSLGDLAGLTVDGDINLTFANGYSLFADQSGNFLRLGDSVKLQLGNTGDLEIFHDGTRSHILNSTDELRIRGNDVRLMNAAGNEHYFVGFANSYSAMYYDNSKKFETTSTGATVTGRLLTDGVSMGDSEELLIGTGNDFKLRHDGTDNHIVSANGDINIQVADSENAIIAKTNGAVELYYDNGKKLETTSTGFEAYGGQFRFNGVEGGASQLLIYADEGDDLNDRWRVMAGGSNDFVIGNLSDASWDTNIKAFGGGAVELYFDDSKKFETRSNGIQVTGYTYSDGVTIGNGTSQKYLAGDASQLQMYHTGNSGNGYLVNSTGTLHLGGGTVGFTNAAVNAFLIRAISGGAAELYHNGSKKFETTTNGTDLRGTLHRCEGHFRPYNNNTWDLGTSGDRWRNIYTNDLNLSNEGGANDVDATWGSYTIQEGAEDLFLINRRNGKKYKFNLTEVS